MTQDERIDMLEARLIAYGIAMTILVEDASPETRATIGRCADASFDIGAQYPGLTDVQRAQIEHLLQSFGQ